MPAGIASRVTAGLRARPPRFAWPGRAWYTLNTIGRRRFNFGTALGATGPRDRLTITRMPIQRKSIAMTSFPRLATLMLSVAALTACTTIFSDDFEADPVGGSPLAAPPGPPAGDSVATQTSAGNSATVSNGAPLDGAHSLVLQGPSAGSRPRVILTAASHPDNGKPILTRFRGQLSPGASAQINMSSGGPFWALQIELSGGTVTANGVNVGTYVQGGTHEVFINMFPTGDFWRFTMTGEANVPDNVGGPLPHPGDFPGDSFGAVIELQAPGAETYRLDNITMNQQT